MSRPKSNSASDELTTASILEYFAAIPDPRIDRTRLHPLTSILALSLLAVICGADSFVAIEEFGAMKMKPSLERALRHKGLLHA